MKIQIGMKNFNYYYNYYKFVFEVYKYFSN